MNKKIKSVFEETGKKAFGNFLDNWGGNITLPLSATAVFEGALRFHDKKSKQQPKELKEIEQRWYQSLKDGKPDYKVYGLPYYYIDLWICWCRYSRRYLLDIQSKKSLFGKSVVSAIKPKTVVDLGCGFGYTTAALKEIFPTAKVIGTNIKGTSQFEVARKIGKQRSFTVQHSIPKADLIFASEYFEHHQEPLKHLEEVIKKVRPSFILFANAFGQSAIGHFCFYKHLGKTVPAKSMNRLFSDTLKERGWRKIKTGCWNNRPQFWTCT